MDNLPSWRGRTGVLKETTKSDQGFLTQEQKQQIEANRLVKQQEMEPIRKEIGNKIGKIHQIQTSNLSEADDAR